MAWEVDPAHTTIGFSVRHMGLSTVRGRFTKFDGTIEGDPNDISGATARLEVDLSSIETGDEKRDQHLRSADFFDVENAPKMIFVSKRIVPAGENRYRVVGDLTIRDVTREIELEYEHAGEGTDPYGKRKAGGTLTGTINRKDWGITWNVALETGGFLVSDKIKLEIDVQVAESDESADGSTRKDAEVAA